MKYHLLHVNKETFDCRSSFYFQKQVNGALFELIGLLHWLLFLDVRVYGWDFLSCENITNNWTFKKMKYS